MDITKFEIEYYKTPSGKIPVKKWRDNLERDTRAIIDTRLARLRLGNFGDCKNLKDGLWELRIQFGSGYRIYYTQIKNKIILLLHAGDKKTQKKDIAKAREYLLNYID